MLNFFVKSRDSKPVKGLKVVQNKDRSKKYGIAASSFEMLKAKVAAKFNLANFDLFTSDGSLIDNEDYFTSVSSQSLVIVAEEGEEVKTDLQVIIESFRKINHEVLHARNEILKFVNDNQNCDVFKALNHVQNEIEEKIVMTSRNDDPSWFEGLDAKLKTKEDVMRRKAQDRIKGYFYKTKDDLTKSQMYRTNSKARAVIDDLLTDFFLFLNGVEYFSCLFDRSYDVKFEKASVRDETDASNAKPKRRRIDSDTKAKIGASDLFRKFQVSLCDQSGSFACHGVWNSSSCTYEHQINPYSSREAVILFQIYNLDHQIEISRSIFPSILRNVEDLLKGGSCKIHNKKAIDISRLTYFREIFTVGNIKLVHIVCHDKGTHEQLKSKGRLVCDKCFDFKQLQKIKLKIA